LKNCYDVLIPPPNRFKGGVGCGEKSRNKITITPKHSARAVLGQLWRSSEEEQ
jgi:hypothetical protein